MTIGIPQALFYWKSPFVAGGHGGHFWQTFFESLGFEVLLSPATNKEIIEKGVKAADTETCFSIKVLYGHILFLEGKADFIFIPRLTKNALGLEYCLKFFALPDQFSILIKTPLISPWLDLKRENFKNILLKIARDLGKERKIAKIAIEQSFQKEEEEKGKSEKEYLRKISSQKKKIVLISHPYNLYDEYVNLRIRKKIEDLGGEVIFIDEVPIRVNPHEPISTVKFHWEFGQEILSQVREIIKERVQGAIEISAFQCGCDAVLKEFVEQEFKKNKIPFLYLLIDEQTGEAGLQTRLEAFFDTLSQQAPFPTRVQS